MSLIRVEIVFDGDVVQARDAAEAFRDAFRRAHERGAFPNLDLVRGPSLSTSWPERQITVDAYLAGTPR